MLESRGLLAGLPAAPPFRQFRTSPAESDVPPEANVRDWIGTAGAALLPYPTRRETPPLSQFFCCQNFKKWAFYPHVSVLQLCSGHFHCLHLQRVTEHDGFVNRCRGRHWPNVAGKGNLAQSTHQSVRVEIKGLSTLYALFVGANFYSHLASCASSADD